MPFALTSDHEDSTWCHNETKQEETRLQTCALAQTSRYSFLRLMSPEASWPCDGQRYENVRIWSLLLSLVFWSIAVPLMVVFGCEELPQSGTGFDGIALHADICHYATRYHGDGGDCCLVHGAELRGSGVKRWWAYSVLGTDCGHYV
jgi:hypothetical protein